MMQVTGEEGISDADFLTQQKAQLIDMVYLQQDAFDPVDVSTPLTRQKTMIALLSRLVDAPLTGADKQAIRSLFARFTDLLRNLNYAAADSDTYQQYLQRIETLLRETTSLKRPPEPHNAGVAVDKSAET